MEGKSVLIAEKSPIWRPLLWWNIFIFLCSEREIKVRWQFPYKTIKTPSFSFSQEKLLSPQLCKYLTSRSRFDLRKNNSLTYFIAQVFCVLFSLSLLFPQRLNAIVAPILWSWLSYFQLWQKLELGALPKKCSVHLNR